MLNSELVICFLNGSFPASFSLFSFFSIQLTVNNVQYKFCRWLDSILESLVSEATTLSHNDFDKLAVEQLLKWKICTQKIIKIFSDGFKFYSNLNYLCRPRLHCLRHSTDWNLKSNRRTELCNKKWQKITSDFCCQSFRSRSQNFVWKVGGGWGKTAMKYNSRIGTRSVTRFGKIWLFWSGLRVSVFETHLENFHCCLWPNEEKMATAFWSHWIRDRERSSVWPVKVLVTSFLPK